MFIRKKQKQKALYVKNFIFGVEDSLVSTVGMLSGVAVAGSARATIILAGLVLIFVEAFSMGVGSLLAEHSADEYLNKKNRINKNVAAAGLIMFLSYFITGFIPLAPYVFWPPKAALFISIGFSVLTLALLGLLAARTFRIGLLHKLLEMVIIGGLAILIGVGVGIWADALLK